MLLLLCRETKAFGGCGAAPRHVLVLHPSTRHRAGSSECATSRVSQRTVVLRCAPTWNPFPPRQRPQVPNRPSQSPILAIHHTHHHQRCQNTSSPSLLDLTSHLRLLRHLVIANADQVSAHHLHACTLRRDQKVANTSYNRCQSHVSARNTPQYRTRAHIHTHRST